MTVTDISKIVLNSKLSLTELSFFDSEGKQVHVHSKYPFHLQKFFHGSGAPNEAIKYINENFPAVEVEHNLKKPGDPGKAILEVTKVAIEYCEGQYSILAFANDKLYSETGFYACDYLKADILEWVSARYPNAQLTEKSVERVKLWGKSSFFDHA